MHRTTRKTKTWNDHHRKPCSSCIRAYGHVPSKRVMVTPAVYPRLFSTTLTFRADVATIMSRRGHHYEGHGFSCRSPALVLNFSPLDILSTARESHCVNTISNHREKISTKTQKIVTHVSVHTLTFHETHYPLTPPGNPNTIQYLIPGRATNVELLKQVKNWQSPSRDLWSNCLIKSGRQKKDQTKYYSGRQKDNSKTICGPEG